MSNFYNVIGEFENLINIFEFKTPKKLWYDHLVALSKNIEDIFYCYIIARVYKHDGSLQTTMWIGPIDRPDDGLEKLSANIKIDIGYTQVLYEDFFKDCERRIINILESGCLAPLVLASKKELKKPSINNKRFKIYTQYLLPFYKMVLTEANNEKKILSSRKKCEPLIEKIFSSLDGELKVFFLQLGYKGTVETIWELCYIYSL